jgi:hypothetical protein
MCGALARLHVKADENTGEVAGECAEVRGPIDGMKDIS